MTLIHDGIDFAMPLNAQRSIIAPSQCLDFDHIVPNRRFSVTTAAEDLPCLASMTARQIPGLHGIYQAFEQVQRHSRSILAIRNKDELVGCFAALLLNGGGFEHFAIAYRWPTRVHRILCDLRKQPLPSIYGLFALPEWL